MTTRGIGNCLVIWYVVDENNEDVSTGCTRIIGSVAIDVIERSRIQNLRLSQQLNSDDPADTPEFVLEINDGLVDAVHQIVTEDEGLAALSWYAGATVPPHELAQLHGTAYSSALETYLAEKNKS